MHLLHTECMYVHVNLDYIKLDSLIISSLLGNKNMTIKCYTFSNVAFSAGLEMGVIFNFNNPRMYLFFAI